MFYRLADGRVTEFIGLMYRMFCELPEKDQQGTDQ